MNDTLTKTGVIAIVDDDQPFREPLQSIMKAAAFDPYVRLGGGIPGFRQPGRHSVPNPRCTLDGDERHRAESGGWPMPTAKSPSFSSPPMAMPLFAIW